MADLRAVVIVGNPKLNSRTRATGENVATTLIGRVTASSSEASVETVEVAELSDRLFAWGDAAVEQAKEVVLGADLLVVASPVYKASFTGLLKSFLDQFGRDELAGVTTIPLMVGAAPDHSLAVEMQLRPVLIEIGASCPTRGLYVLEDEIETIDDQLSAWLEVWGGSLRRALSAEAP